MGERIQVFNAAAAASHNYNISVNKWPAINAVRVRITQDANWVHKAECLMDTGPHQVYFGRRMEEPTMGQYLDDVNGTVFNVGSSPNIAYNESTVPTVSHSLRSYDGTTDFGGTSGVTLAQQAVQAVSEQYVDKAPFEGTGSASVHVGSTGKTYGIFFDNGSGTNTWQWSELNHEHSHMQSAKIEVIFEID